MSEMVMLCGDQPQKILHTVIQAETPAIMSYLSKGKWHVAKVLLTNLSNERLCIESVCSRNKYRPINIQVDQPVGISFKHDYGKYIFESTVLALEPLPECRHNKSYGGTIVLATPDKIEVVQRRSYYRVNVPESLNVKVLLWHRSVNQQNTDNLKEEGKRQPSTSCYQGRLIDISAGGAQIIVPYENSQSNSEYNVHKNNDGVNPKSTIRNFRKGQFIGLRFTPMPYETPLTLSAQIRNILPTAEGRSQSLGLQIVGLEASNEGRQVLTRLIAVVGKYYKMNESGLRQVGK